MRWTVGIEVGVLDFPANRTVHSSKKPEVSTATVGGLKVNNHNPGRVSKDDFCCPFDFLENHSVSVNSDLVLGSGAPVKEWLRYGIKGYTFEPTDVNRGPKSHPVSFFMS